MLFFFQVIIVSRIIGSENMEWFLKYISKSVTAHGEQGLYQAWSKESGCKYTHTHTHTQQMAWHISGFTLSRGDKEVWESTSLPSSYSKKSVCRFTQTNTLYVSRLMFAVCLFIFFKFFQLFDTNKLIQCSLWPWHIFIDLGPRQWA